MKNKRIAFSFKNNKLVEISDKDINSILESQRKFMNVLEGLNKKMPGLLY